MFSVMWFKKTLSYPQVTLRMQVGLAVFSNKIDISPWACPISVQMKLRGPGGWFIYSHWSMSLGFGIRKHWIGTLALTPAE